VWNLTYDVQLASRWWPIIWWFEELVPHACSVVSRRITCSNYKTYLTMCLDCDWVWCVEWLWSFFILVNYMCKCCWRLDELLEVIFIMICLLMNNVMKCMFKPVLYLLIMNDVILTPNGLWRTAYLSVWMGRRHAGLDALVLLGEFAWGAGASSFYRTCLDRLWYRIVCLSFDFWIFMLLIFYPMTGLSC